MKTTFTVLLLLTLFHPLLTTRGHDPEVVKSSTGTEMILVKGGTFQMGSNEKGVGSDEKPQHSVTVSEFYIASTEVTFAEFAKFIAATEYKTSAEINGFSYVRTKDEWEKIAGVNWTCDEWGNIRDISRENHPVVHVSWYDAVEYCNWLSKKDGLTPAYSVNKDVKDPNNLDTLSDTQKWIVKCDFSANGYRLPTEAEWEFAARGGNESKGYMFPGSDDFREVGHVFSSKPWKEGMIEVGSYKPNELGLFNMAGNVTEWCWDWFGDYTTDAQTDPRGPESGRERVKRNGSWYGLIYNCRTTSRTAYTAETSFFELGFRVARSAK